MYFIPLLFQQVKFSLSTLQIWLYFELRIPPADKSLLLEPLISPTLFPLAAQRSLTLSVSTPPPPPPI